MVITLFLILKTGTQNWTPYKITQTTTENVACGQYTYLIKENKIQIDNQIFTITDNNGTLVLQNEDWKLVLVEK